MNPYTPVTFNSHYRIEAKLQLPQKTQIRTHLTLRVRQRSRLKLHLRLHAITPRLQATNHTFKAHMIGKIHNKLTELQAQELRPNRC